MDDLAKAKEVVESSTSRWNRVISYEVRNGQLIANLLTGTHLWVKIG